MSLNGKHPIIDASDWLSQQTLWLLRTV